MDMGRFFSLVVQSWGIHLEEYRLNLKGPIERMRVVDYRLIVGNPGLEQLPIHHSDLTGPSGQMKNELIPSYLRYLTSVRYLHHPKVQLKVKLVDTSLDLINPPIFHPDNRQPFILIVAITRTCCQHPPSSVQKRANPMCDHDDGVSFGDELLFDHLADCLLGGGV